MWVLEILEFCSAIFHGLEPGKRGIFLQVLETPENWYIEGKIMTKIKNSKKIN